MAIFSDFEIFGHFLNVSGIPQSDHYASKSAGYCLYIMLWVYNIIYMPKGRELEVPKAKNQVQNESKIAQSWQG